MLFLFKYESSVFSVTDFLRIRTAKIIYLQKVGRVKCCTACRVFNLTSLLQGLNG